MKRKKAIKILEKWKGGSLNTLNRSLRKGSELNESEAINCKSLSQALKKYCGHQYKEVWRNDDLERFLSDRVTEKMNNEMVVSYFKSLQGKIIKRPEFLGTSIVRWKILENKYVLRILLPRKKHNGVFLPSILKASFHKHYEQEVLLPRNSKFMVLKIDQERKFITLKKVKRNAKVDRICMGDDFLNFAKRNFQGSFPLEYSESGNPKSLLDEI